MRLSVRDRSSLRLFQKNHCCSVSFENGMYLTPAHNSKVTSSSRNAQYCRYQTYESRHEISNNVVCATSKASDQPAHTRSLIRAFASRLDIL